MSSSQHSASVSSPVTPLDRLWRPFLEFAKIEASGGIVLMLCAIVALVWANSAAAPAYFELWQKHFSLGIEGWFEFSKTLEHWINDGLMAVFFFQVGLEIKRELLTGALNTRSKATLPVLAALGGMIVPALIYTAFNHDGPGRPGWGIPMATDIAFSLGVLSLLGRRVPAQIKIFLAALAIADDLGAVLVIAFFYTAEISTTALAWGAAAWAALLVFCRLGGRSPIVFTVLAALLWLAVLKSGVHATIAGVLAAFAVPSKTLPEEDAPPLEGWAHHLHPWVAFLIMPLFALANAGVALGDAGWAALKEPIALGIICGLVLGKTVGIFSFIWLGVKVGLASRPDGVTWGHCFGLALLAGIGFTMSIFVAGLAFPGSPLLDNAKAAIMAASALAAVCGGTALLLFSRRPTSAVATTVGE